jgi:hypothetical protein
MSTQKTFLIHGSAVMATYPLIRPNLSPHLGFAIFEKQLEDGEAMLFRWGKEKHYSALGLFNPFEYLTLYREEHVLATSKQTHENLLKQLEEYQPTVIVCHSMGGSLLYQFSQNHSLPSSVKTIIFVQADVCRNSKIPQNWEHITIKNVWCFWDQALWESLFVNRYLPAGLFGLTSKNVQNIFMPLYLTLNLHESPLHDPNLLDLTQTD